MTILLKLFSGLFGYDYQKVMQQPTVSKQKIVTMGTLLFIPVALWTFSGYYMARYMVGAGQLVSLMIALFMGMIILVVDRSFVTTPKAEMGSMLKCVRLGFALVSSVLGSLAIDMVLFSGDLEEFRQKQAEMQKTVDSDAYKEKHAEGLAKLRAERDEAHRSHQELVSIYFDELDGKLGTGVYGSGKVAAAKELEKDKAALRAEQLDARYEAALLELDVKAEEHAVKTSEKRSDALLSKVRDLHSFVMSDGITLAFYLFFFAFVLMLEAFFMMYKSSVSESIFESFLQAEEACGKQRLQAYKARRSRLTTERSLLGEDYDMIERLIRTDARRKAG